MAFLPDLPCLITLVGWDNDNMRDDWKTFMNRDVFHKDARDISADEITKRVIRWVPGM